MEIHSIHCPAYLTPAMEDANVIPGKCNCKHTEREYYPDGLFEFDVGDRSAPGDDYPAMLRLAIQRKSEMIGLAHQLLVAIANSDERQVFTFSGKLRKVND